MTVTLNGGNRIYTAKLMHTSRESFRKFYWNPERHLDDTKRAMPNAAAAANPPISAVRAALDPGDVPV
jgi:hypothetical protein